MTDMLTGLMSKREFVEALESAVASEETVTLGLIDLDNFKQVNDRLGIEAGDRVLAAVSQVLKGVAEPWGWAVGRIGGDEFAVCMSGVSLEKGFLLAEELRRDSVRALETLYPDCGVTVSIGVANAPRDAKDAQGLLGKADHALYQGKEAGRNQVSLPWTDEMVLRSCYYSTSQLGRLKKLAESLKRKESVLLREALDDLLRKYDKPQG